MSKEISRVEFKCDKGKNLLDMPEIILCYWLPVLRMPPLTEILFLVTLNLMTLLVLDNSWKPAHIPITGKHLKI